MSAEVPWVADDEAREVDERRLAALEGRRVQAVRYFELDHPGDGESPEPAWRGGDFDSLDYGLELDLDDGTMWSFIWLQAGHNEGLLAFQGALRPTQLREDAACAVWEVAGESGWPAIAGLPVEAVEGAWDRHIFEPGGPSDLCVLTWVLRHRGGEHVVITLGDRDADGSYRYTHESVAVFFSLADARRHGVFLPGDGGMS